MSYKGWRRHSDGDVAVDKILDAAGLAFAERGIQNAKMTDIARSAGCSRATLYRYFPNQQALHLAFVHRATLRIIDAHGPTAPESIVERILAGIEAVRSDPILAVWFEPENMAVPIAVSQNSELLHAMTAGLIDQFGADSLPREEIERRGEWLLRNIIMMLAMPGRNPDEERALLESFVLPALIAAPSSKGSQV